MADVMRFEPTIKTLNFRYSTDLPIQKSIKVYGKEACKFSANTIKVAK